jgi:carboxymethylenebutenolidase
VRYGSNNNGAPTAMALAYADEVKLPVLGNYGELDKSILAEDVRALQARLPSTNDFKIYPEAGHAFFDDTRSSYVASAATDGWARTLAWFARYL